MYEFFKFLHLAAAIVWLGGMTLLLWALRPVAIAQLQPPQRLPLLAGVLERFFVLVWLSIALLLGTGGYMLAGVEMRLAPRGWHAMLGMGLLMFAVFGHLYFAPFRRLKAAVAARDWPEAGRRAAQIHPLVLLNFCLGWLAVAAVLLWR